MDGPEATDGSQATRENPHSRQPSDEAGARYPGLPRDCYERESLVELSDRFARRGPDVVRRVLFYVRFTHMIHCPICLGMLPVMSSDAPAEVLEGSREGDS